MGWERVHGTGQTLDHVMYVSTAVVSALSTAPAGIHVIWFLALPSQQLPRSFTAALAKGTWRYARLGFC